MEKIVNHRNKTHSLTELGKTLKKQTALETMVIKARLASPSLFELDENNKKVFCDNVIMKCSAFMGCDLPSSDYFADNLSNSILEFMDRMGYNDLSIEEITVAFSINCRHQLKLSTGIEISEIPFYGKTANISFLSKIFDNYMQVRNQLDRRFQNLIDGYE